MTQSNAGAANELSATSVQLAGEARRLNERTGFFQIEQEAPRRQRAADNANAPGEALTPATSADNDGFERGARLHLA